MADLNRIFVIHTTADEDDANSDGNFELVVSRPNGDLFLFLDTPDYDDRERGDTDQYEFDVSNEGVTTDSVLSIRMTSTDDGWLLKSVWAIGQTVAGSFEVLAAHPVWENGWFDRGDPATPDTHQISN
jgi:PLAT/LH2 domain